MAQEDIFGINFFFFFGIVSKLLQQLLNFEATACAQPQGAAQFLQLF